MARTVIALLIMLAGATMTAAANPIDQYNVAWTTQSKHAGESMPVSGGDIGLNVWVENDDPSSSEGSAGTSLLVYMGRAGCRDENGALLKPGRLRVKFTPNPFENAEFRQELKLHEGYVLVTAKQPNGDNVAIKVWVEVEQPIVHLDIESDSPVTAEATYESWRFEDVELPNDSNKYARRGMCMMNCHSYQGKVFVYKDEISATERSVRFLHRVDNDKGSFDFQVKQQKLEPVRDQLVNPMEDLIWGGALVGDNFALAGETNGTYAETPFKGWKYVSKTPATSHRIRVCLHTDQTAEDKDWDAGLQKLVDRSPKDDAKAWEANQKWWADFWNRSHLVINSGRGHKDAGWRIGRNYQLFRYMLASNVHGHEATQFNGGVFTFDPAYVNGWKGPGFTPDHRQWGAGFTAQNQRMMVWPLLKSGDFDMVEPGFSLYLDTLPNAMARVRHNWKHDGCCFTEQTANTGLPGAAMYGFDQKGGRSRPQDLETGVQVNTAARYIYESQLEYAWLMLSYHQFTGADLTPYLKFIEQSVIFYDEHYRFRCKELTGKELDENGKLAIFPSSTLEYHPDARNPTSVIAGLTRVLGELIDLPEKYTSAEKKERWQSILATLPEMPTGTNEKYGGTYLKPAENFGHRSWHNPEMYPLHPYALHGIGQGDLDLMKHTSKAIGRDMFNVTAWRQGNIHAARLGDIKLAQQLNLKKMDNGPYRFPAFWPHNIDWAPDHNWGGSGMIGMQEMVMQTHALPGEKGKIRLLPAWPEKWDVDFKLHAPHQTVVECSFEDGEVKRMEVTPEGRRDDVIVMDSRPATHD